ncbi:MAG: flagellar biosynthetic protein FliO [Oscillospiraceae bacterium]|nr:flagellar biosynthetic protein FliO [Oscillospiraceae bacterium]
MKTFTSRISTSGGRLRVLDRASLGRDSMILVVSVCGKLLLVGVSPHRVEKLDELDMSEEEYTEAAFSAARGNVVPFSDILSSIGIKKKSEKSANNDNDDNEEIGVGGAEIAENLKNEKTEKSD